VKNGTYHVGVTRAPYEAIFRDTATVALPKRAKRYQKYEKDSLNTCNVADTWLPPASKSFTHLLCLKSALEADSLHGC
jgi:hypothetical protein